MYHVTLIPGDGIGPEVAGATRLVLEATGVPIEWTLAEAGVVALERSGTTLPESTMDAIRACRVALKGPITTPVGTGFRSVNVALRQELDLFAAVRPARSLPGVPTRHPGVDLVVIRENTEDLYQGIEFECGSEQVAKLRTKLQALAGVHIREDAGVTVKPISVTGTRRIVYFAFDFARWNGRRVVTVGHKANIMRFSDGLFLETAREEAANHYDVEYREVQIDHLSMRLTREPQSLDILLLPNLYGDILSDLGAGLVGGPGAGPRREPRLGVLGVRARARKRARHRGPRAGEPDRDDPLGGDDAPPPRGAARGRERGAGGRPRARRGPRSNARPRRNGDDDAGRGGDRRRCRGGCAHVAFMRPRGMPH